MFGREQNQTGVLIELYEASTLANEDYETTISQIW
jgi:hypothetical protein